MYSFGFPYPMQIKEVFSSVYPETDGYQAEEYAHANRYRCFYIMVMEPRWSGLRFVMAYSVRGDFRMTACPPITRHSRLDCNWKCRDRVDALITHLIRKSKSKILVIHSINGYKPKQDFKGKCLLIERKE